MIASMASIGLTVALFVAGEAFPDPTLQAEAKLGALLSGLMGCAAEARDAHRPTRATRHALRPPCAS